MNIEKRISNSGTVRYYLGDQIHNDGDEPAVIQSNGTKKWYKHGKRHRVNGPAAEFASGARHWYYNGTLHRIGGPAVLYANGDTEWFFKGLLHNFNGPAVVEGNGKFVEWWIYGKEYYTFEAYAYAIGLTDEEIISMKLENNC